MTTTVKFELAQILKEKGYDVPTLSFYFKIGAKGNGGTPFNWNIYKHKDSDFSAPTIAEVCMWLYEKHGIWIEVGSGNLFHKDKFYILIKIHNVDRWDLTSLDNKIHSPYNTPTEAYEAAIEYVLKNLNLTNETNNNK